MLTYLNVMRTIDKFCIIVYFKDSVWGEKIKQISPFHPFLKPIWCHFPKPVTPTLYSLVLFFKSTNFPSFSSVPVIYYVAPSTDICRPVIFNNKGTNILYSISLVFLDQAF